MDNIGIYYDNVTSYLGNEYRVVNNKFWLNLIQCLSKRYNILKYLSTTIEFPSAIS